MAFQRENQRITSSDLLQALASGEDIQLDRCTISGDVDLNRLFVAGENFEVSLLNHRQEGSTTVVRLSAPISMRSCVFENNVFFGPPWDKPEALAIVFERDVAFNSSRFLGQARFSGSRFEQLASFDGCTFEHVADLRKTRFAGRAMFRTVNFEGYGLFTGAVFEGNTRFDNTAFGKGGNFNYVTFGGRTDFAGVYSKSKSVPVYESVRFARRYHGDDETFWRFIKQASQDAGFYQLAGESFYNERCAHFWRRFRGACYGELSPGRKVLRWLAGIRLLPELVFGRLLFGYGERPIRVLVASLLIILLCGLFFSSPAASVSYRDETFHGTLELMDGLYFSTITFTTLGFGDMYPARGHLPTRLVAMFESISGACLMALFVVSLSKRFSRG